MVFFLGPYKLGVYKLSKKPEACVFKKVIFVDDSNSTTSKENLRQVFGVSDSDKTPVLDWNTGLNKTRRTRKIPSGLEVFGSSKFPWKLQLL